MDFKHIKDTEIVTPRPNSSIICQHRLKN